MKNIFLLVDILNSLSGGAERQILELAKNIDKSKYQLIVGCLSSENSLLREIETHGVKTISFKVKRIYDLFGINQGFKFVKFLKKEKVDILMTYHFGSDIWGAWFGRLAGVRVIISNRRDVGFWKSRHHNLAYKIVNHWVDRIIAVSEAVKNTIIESEGVSPAKIEVIYSGVNLDFLSQEIDATSVRKELGLNFDAPIVGVVSWFRSEKGVEYFLQAAAKVKEGLPETQFVIVGDGPLREKMLNLTKELNLEQTIRFLGWRLDVPRIMHTFDILVSPSLTEGFSNVVIEAMASGKPVVATRVGGNKEAVIDQKTGILVKPGDAQALANAITFILHNSKVRQDLGNAGRERVKQKFTLSASIQKLQKLTDECFYAKKKFYISSFPIFSFSKLLKSFHPSPDIDLSGNHRIVYTYSASSAIYKTVKLLNLKNEDNILMPAYHCGVEVDMALQAGTKVKFYNVLENTLIDLGDIKRKVDKNTKAVFVIHYFGFIQPLEQLRRFCNENDLILIEDCAHLLANIRQLQNHFLGDIQIFSFMKTLPIADGGCLISRKPIPDGFYNRKINRALLLRRILLSLNFELRRKNNALYLLFNTFVVGFLRLSLRLFKKASPTSSLATLERNNREFYVKISDLSISKISLNILQETDFETAINNRRENYKFLLENFIGCPGIKIPVPKLADNSSPLFFPILSEHRDILLARLVKRGLYSCIFGKALHSELPADNFVAARDFSKLNLCLPVHQDLSQEELEYIVYVFKDELEKLASVEKDKICHLISSSGLFGAEKVMLNIAEASNANGHRSWVIGLRNTQNPHEEVIEEAKKRNIPTQAIESRGRFDFSAVNRLTQFIKENNIGILHTHNYKANFIGLLAAKRAKIPIVATLHGYIGNGRKLRFYETLDRFILRYFNKVILVDDGLKKWFKNGSVKYEVINNGIKIDGTQRHPSTALGAGKITRSQVKTKLGIDENDLVIGTVGRLSEEKGHKYLIEAFAKLAKEFPDIRLLIVGDGELRKELEKLSETLGLKEKVTFVGFQEDVAQYYALMDIYVSPSLVEHFPMSILEAMSFGKAVVATDVGGTSKLIKKNAGILIKPASSEEIYTALLKLINAVELRKALGESARRFVKENFSLEKMLCSYRKVYKDVLVGDLLIANR
jgi:glycosyltransferase involved in cell wall biosynthesis/dTDP-4-amino-4,6-dideoxygalactose transaminase